MIGGIIVSHGRLAEELLNALTIILGEAPNIEAISIGWYDDVEDSKKKISQCLKRVDQKSGAVIFTDMFGGTPSNLSFSFLKENHVEIITGASPPGPRSSSSTCPIASARRSRSSRTATRSTARAFSAS